MTEFLTLLDPEEALATFFDHFQPQPESAVIPTTEALGRVAAEDLAAPHALPSFQRSTVDGYAVRAEDTHAARESLPAYLTLMAEVPMGGAPAFRLDPRACAKIHTGGMLPEGADAVVMIEDTQLLPDQEIEIFRSCAVGENVIQVGEDIKAGEILISRGKKLRTPEIGGLLALGIIEIPVAVRPRVGIISSGDEVIPPEEDPGPGQVRDINSYTLGGLISEAGGSPHYYGIISDEYQEMLDALQQAQRECDLVIVTAGSSASHRDLTATVMNDLGEPGVLVHGVNVKPGKPTIFAVADQKPLIGLPGNPVSALVIATLFVKPILSACLGMETPISLPAVPAKLTTNLSSKTGREDWVPVELIRNPDGKPFAQPVFGKSNLIFVLVKAHGLVRIPPAAGGLEAGAEVSVLLLG